MSEKQPPTDPFDAFVTNCITAPDDAQFLPVTINVLGPTSPNHINRNIEILARESMVIDLGPLSGLNYKIKIYKCTEEEQDVNAVRPGTVRPTVSAAAASAYEVPKPSAVEDVEEDL